MIWNLVWFGLGIIAAHLVYARLRGNKKLLGYTLIVAALVYVCFALIGGASSNWLVIELLGVAAYTMLASLSMRGSAWWLVAGWGLHPIWDMVVHFVLPANHAHFVPVWYAIACLSFDVLIAAYIARDLLKKSEYAIEPVIPTKAGIHSRPPHTRG